MSGLRVMCRGLLAVVLILVATAAHATSVGDTIVFVDTDFDTADTLDLAAASSTENICQTIDHTDNIDLYAYDGTADKLVRSYTGVGLEAVFLRVTATERYRVKSGTGGANNAYLRVICVRVK